MLIDSGSESRPESTVEPVVVSPDIASKYASVNDSPGMPSSSGMLAEPDISTQLAVASRKPRRAASSSRACLRVASEMSAPAPELVSARNEKHAHLAVARDERREHRHDA